MKAEPQTFVIVEVCTTCGEEVPISGTIVLSGEVMTFRSDERGTNAAWEHQELHEEETR